MKFRPRALEKYISTLPTDLQELALQTVVQERNRIKNGPWTEEEIRMTAQVKGIAVNARKKMEKIAMSYFK